MKCFCKDGKFVNTKSKNKMKKMFKKICECRENGFWLLQVKWKTLNDTVSGPSGLQV